MGKDIDRRQKRFLFWQPAGVIIAVIALTLTAIGTFFEIRSRELKAELQIISADRLTQTRDIPGLEANFKFKGSSTKDLWKLKVRFINTGDLTIVGEGYRKNICGDFIKIGFPSDVKVFEPQKELDNFPHTLRAVKESENQFILKFSQWRSTEDAVYSFYISSDTRRDKLPTPKFPRRDIIDGNLSVRNLCLSQSSHKQPLIDNMPKPLAFAGRILGVTGIIIMTGFLIYATFVMAKDSLPWLIWRYRYYAKFISYAESIKVDFFLEDHLDKERFIEAPWHGIRKKEFWEGFKGPQCPTTWPEWENWYRLFMWLGILSISICACCALVVNNNNSKSSVIKL